VWGLKIGTFPQRPPSGGHFGIKQMPA